jgi:thiol-disulfide isomerase/thioredoxin
VTLASDGGRLVFQMAPDETDVLDVARGAWARLTPAQRDLTLATVMQRTDLWPYRVRANIGFEVGGRTIRRGDPLLLLDGQGGEITVRIEGTDIGVNLQPQETDLVAQARGFLATDGAPGRLLEELAGKLVNPVDGRPIALPASARPRLVVLYMGASWCGPCQKFSPGLVELLKDRGTRPEDVLAVYLSGDRSPAECKKYVEHLGIDWPTVRYQNSGQLPAFSRHFGQYIPQVVVTDRHGRVLIDSATVGTERALAELGKLL